MRAPGAQPLDAYGEPRWGKMHAWQASRNRWPRPARPRAATRQSSRTCSIACPRPSSSSILAGRFVYVNRTGLERFGYTEAELSQGVSVMNVVIPEERDHLRANIARRLGGGETEGFQYTAQRKDGGTFPALVHTIVVNKDGRPCGVQGYLIDISERVRTENALRRRVALEQLIMRASTRLVAELAPGELDARIDDALAEIGRFLNVDRSYVFLFSPDGAFMDNTHEWVGDGVSVERSNLQHLPVQTSFPWFVSELRRRLVVPVPLVAELPPEADAEKAEFEREGIHSLICVAMIHAGTVGGFLGSIPSAASGIGRTMRFRCCG